MTKTIRLITIAAGALSVVLLAGALAAAAGGRGFEPITGPGPLGAAAAECDPLDAGTDLGDGDHSLSVDGTGREDSYGITMTQMTCLLDALGAPMHVRERIGMTRALDGQQQATWSGVEMSWTYHPDSGLDAILTTR